MMTTMESVGVTPMSCRTAWNADRRSSQMSRVAAALLIAGIVMLVGVHAAPTEVVVDASRRFQTIEGWGNSGADLGVQFLITHRLLGAAVGDPINEQYIDFLV